MDDAQLVAVDERVKDWSNYVAGFLLREFLFFEDLIKELLVNRVNWLQMCTYLASHHELHDQEEVFLIFVDVMQFDDIGMIHLLQDIDFILETNSVFLSQFTSRDAKKIGQMDK